MPVKKKAAPAKKVALKKPTKKQINQARNMALEFEGNDRVSNVNKYLKSYGFAPVTAKQRDAARPRVPKPKGKTVTFRRPNPYIADNGAQKKERLKKKATVENNRPSEKKAPAKKARKKAPSRGGRRANAGGARPGSGRKKGAATKKTREIADKAASDGGILPLDYMLDVLRTTDDDLRAQYKAGEIDTAEFVVRLKHNMDRRDNFADKAAPYLHPRLSSVTAQVVGTDHDRWVQAMTDAGLL